MSCWHPEMLTIKVLLEKELGLVQTPEEKRVIAFAMASTLATSWISKYLVDFKNYIVKLV